MTFFKLDKGVRGPGTFTYLEENKNYSRLVKQTIKSTLIEESKLCNVKKDAAILAQHRINQLTLTLLYNSDNCSLEELGHPNLKSTTPPETPEY